MAEADRKTDRRGFLGEGIRVAGAVGLGGLAGLLAHRRGRAEEYVWQIDPDKCIACDKCQTECVLDPSAVRAEQCFLICGYCDICTGYFPPTDFELDTAAENQLCPTGAIRRTLIEEQAGVRYFEYTVDTKRRLVEGEAGAGYYEYTIDDRAKCIGCGKCVKGCALMNGSLYMQVRHDLCVNCNECAIAVACPTQAFCRLPAGTPTLLKRKAREAVIAKERELANLDPRKLPKEKARELELSKNELRELLRRDARDIVDQRAQDG